MKILISTVAIFVFIIDQFSKFLISRNLNPGQSVEVIKNIFCLTLVHNTGAAFGIFRNQTISFTIISVLAVIGIVMYMRKKRDSHLLKDVALALILGGALGNLVDRLRFGYVVDFLDFKIWPVFNLADSAITIGAFLLILSLVRRRNVSRTL